MFWLKVHFPYPPRQGRVCIMKITGRRSCCLGRGVAAESRQVGVHDELKRVDENTKESRVLRQVRTANAAASSSPHLRPPRLQPYPPRFHPPLLQPHLLRPGRLPACHHEAAPFHVCATQTTPARSGWDKRQAKFILYIYTNGVSRIPPKIISTENLQNAQLPRRMPTLVSPRCDS